MTTYLKNAQPSWFTDDMVNTYLDEKVLSLSDRGLRKQEVYAVPTVRITLRTVQACIVSTVLYGTLRTIR